MATEDKFIVAIELGSSKVTGIAGRKQPDGATQILAFAQEPSTTFIRKGRINNVNKMTQCILNMKEKLEQKMQKSISRVYVGIGGMGMHTVANSVIRHFDSKVEITQDMVDDILGILIPKIQIPHPIQNVQDLIQNHSRIFYNAIYNLMYSHSI